MAAAGATPTSFPDSIYAGRVVAFLTQHGKEALTHALTDRLGCVVERATGVDTDTFGTFNRLVPRSVPAVEAARAKARLACSLHGTSLGLGSEGSFGLDPALGLLPWSYEVVAFHDAERGLDVTGRANGWACWAHARVREWSVAEEFARRCRFPSHALAVRPHDTSDPRIRMDITDWDALRDAFESARHLAGGEWVSLEVDGRAHRNPTRQEVIRSAMCDLAARVACPCPACGSPGFGRGEPIPGRPCEGCGRPGSRARAYTWACVRCQHMEERGVDAPHADPGECETCNP